MPEKEAGSPIETRWLGRIAFQDALELQESLVRERQAGAGRDTLLLLEHEPVYTIGRTRDRSSLRDSETGNVPVLEINRGGQATYHGPGQLVGYLVFDLAAYGRDLHRFLRALEDELIASIRCLNVPAGRRDGLTGVWVESRKLVSIGIGVRKWVCMHGFALNVERDLSGFNAIIPCGIQDVEMTSLSRETGQDLTVEEVAQTLAPLLQAGLTRHRLPPA